MQNFPYTKFFLVNTCIWVQNHYFILSWTPKFCCFTLHHIFQLMLNHVMYSLNWVQCVDNIFSNCKFCCTWFILLIIYSHENSGQRPWESVWFGGRLPCVADSPDSVPAFCRCWHWQSESCCLFISKDPEDNREKNRKTRSYEGTGEAPANNDFILWML